jgi:PAS domain S-box-containing protein
MSDIDPSRQIDVLKERIAELEDGLSSGWGIRSLLDLLPQTIAKLDPQGRILFVNQGGLDAFGYTKEDLNRALSIFDMLAPQEVPRAKALFSSITRDENAHSDEYLALRKDGKTFPVNIFTKPVFLDGHCVSVGAVLVDITDQKQKEADMRESTQRFQLLAEISSDAAFSSSRLPDGSFQRDWFSGRLPREMGYSFADVTSGWLWESIVHAEDLPRYVETQRAVLEGQPATAELRIRRKDGGYCWVRCAWKPIKDAFGNVNRVLSTYKDISTEHQAIENYRMARNLLREAIDQSPIGMMLCYAPTVQVFMVNKAAADILGQSVERQLALSQENTEPINWQAFTVDKEFVPFREYPLARAVREGLVERDREFVIKRADGTERTVLISASPIHDGDGNITAAITVISDITEIRRAAFESQKIEKLESLGILAGGLAHDFNNILAVILGNANLLLCDFNEDSDAFKPLKDIEQAARRASDLTFQLLTFSKGGAPIKEAASLSDIIRESSSFAASGSKVEIEYSFEDKLWPALVDRGQFSQIIQNLVINAREAMPNGGKIYITASNQLEGDEYFSKPPYVLIKFCDTGVGIKEENLKRVFDPYFTTKPTGSGLGLSIVFSIVRKHGGSIRVESIPNSGTCFFLYLPASPGEFVESRQEKAPNFAGNGRILVMDDEADPRTVLVRMLSHFGFEPDTAADGLTSIEMFSQAYKSAKPYSGVILDLTVPGGMGGADAIRELKKIDPAIKAIVSSGYSNDPVLANCEEYGFSSALKKPFTVNELCESLESLGLGRRVSK